MAWRHPSVGNTRNSQLAQFTAVTEVAAAGTVGRVSETAMSVAGTVLAAAGTVGAAVGTAAASKGMTKAAASEGMEEITAEAQSDLATHRLEAACGRVPRRANQWPRPQVSLPGPESRGSRCCALQEGVQQQKEGEKWEVEGAVQTGTTSYLPPEHPVLRPRTPQSPSPAPNPVLPAETM